LWAISLVRRKPKSRRLSRVRGFSNTVQFLLLIVVAGGVSALTIGVVVWAARRLGLTDTGRPEVLLPLVLVAGLIALVIALTILVAAFHLFGLTNSTKPFGVPEGTLQAVIALSLILIFAIASLYLRGTFNHQVVTVSNLTPSQAARIPGDQVLSKTTTGYSPLRFEVQRELPVDQDAKDFSNQLLTILGTLVGAVAGFYFGAKSVETRLAGKRDGLRHVDSARSCRGAWFLSDWPYGRERREIL
jgi:hypothetical protein